MELNVAIAADKNYWVHLATTAQSVLDNNYEEFDKIHFYLLYDGVPKEEQEKIFELVAGKPKAEISLHDILIFVENAAYLSRGRMRNWPRVIWGRVFLDEVIENEVEQILYLDSDVIVCSHLKEMFENRGGDWIIKGVLDTMNIQYKRKLGMDQSEGYINTGVLLINMPRWRESKCQKKIIDYIKSEDAELILPDQDAINSVINAKCTLPLKYNLLNPIKHYSKSYLA